MADPTADIPPEILCEILATLRFGTTTTKPSSTEWLRATWVCRRWRDIAISTPTLWTWIYVRGNWSQEMFQAFLERSAGLDLTLDIDHDYPLVELLLEPLTAHSHRIESLGLTCWASEKDSVQAVVDRLGPKLTSLQLSGSSGDVRLTDSHSSLRTLSAIRAKPLPDSQLLSLTSLELIGQVFSHHDRFEPYLSTLVSFCPNIENLTIMDGWGGLTLTKSSTPLLSLRNLKTVRLRDSFHRMPILAAILHAPHAAAVHLEVQSDSCLHVWKRDTGRTSVFLAFLPQESAETIPAIARSHQLRLTLGSEDAIAILAGYGGEEMCLEWSIAIVTEPGDVETDYRDDFTGLPPLLPRELTLLGSLVGAIELDIHFADSVFFPNDGWLDVLKAYPQLQKVTIGGAVPARRFVYSVGAAVCCGHLPRLTELVCCVRKLPVALRADLIRCAETCVSRSRPFTKLAVCLSDCSIAEEHRTELEDLKASMPLEVQFAVMVERCSTCHPTRRSAW